MVVSEMAVGSEVIEPLIDRLIGRTAFEAVVHPETEEVLAEKEEIISEDQAKKIVEAGITEVTIRSVFTCNTKHGVCKQCYGRNLTTGADVEMGEPVGIVAAESID